jgi:four helix bundle protein
MTLDELSKRLWHFAARVGNVVEALPDTRLGRHIAGQLVRCGTSSPPNYDEGCAAESRADFVHKLGIALKELKETQGWLHLIIISHLISEKRITPLRDECCELSKILGRSIVTAKSKGHKGSSPAPHSA